MSLGRNYQLFKNLLDIRYFIQSEGMIPGPGGQVKRRVTVLFCLT